MWTSRQGFHKLAAFDWVIELPNAPNDDHTLGKRAESSSVEQPMQPSEFAKGSNCVKTYQKYTDIGEYNAKRCSQIKVVAQMTATIATSIVNDLFFNCIAFKSRLQKD